MDEVGPDDPADLRRAELLAARLREVDQDMGQAAMHGLVEDVVHERRQRPSRAVDVGLDCGERFG